MLLVHSESWAEADPSTVCVRQENCPHRVYRVQEHPNAVGLGAISDSYGSWEPKILSVRQKVGW